MTNLLQYVFLVSILAVPNHPASYRVVVLDCSGSMDQMEVTGSPPPRRIDVALAEIRQVARQLPPSTANPLALVLFTDQARSHEFTDLASLEAALDRVTTGGGTAISSGLKATHALLQQAQQSTAMFVLLYTDGENGEPDGEQLVAAQEAALDQLFSNRNQRGLATHVICRRWANANNDWVSALKRKPHWGVLDAGGLGLKSVTAAPVLDVVSTRWVNDQNLEVELRGHAHVSETNGGINQLAIQCVNGKLPGEKSVALPSDERKPATFLVSVNVANIDTKAGRGYLHFQVQSLAPRVVGKDVLVPSVDPHVSVTFEIPPRERTISLQGELKPLASRWTNPGERQVTAEVELSLDVQTVQGNQGPWPTPFDVLIEPVKDVYLVKGSPILRVSGDGKASTRISLGRELPVGLAEGELSVRLVPQNAPSYYTLRPETVIARATFARPAPANTEVIAKAGPPVRGRWIDVGRELALFEFPISVVVRGPTTDSSFTIVAPPNVFGIDIKPSTLRSGEQSILVRMEARSDASVPAVIQLDIVPPPATDVVQYTVPHPLDVRIIGPPPVQLVLVDGQELANGLRIDIPDTMDTYEDVLTTALLGADEGVTASGIRAKLTGTANLPFTIGSSSQIGETVPYSFRIPADHNQNFWLDSRYEVDVKVETDRPVQSIVGSNAVIQLVIPAPFKRWLFGLLVVLGVVALFVGPFFALRRVHREQECDMGSVIEAPQRISYRESRRNVSRL